MSSSSAEPKPCFINNYFDRHRTYRKMEKYDYSWTIHNFSDWMAEAGEKTQYSPLFPDDANSKHQWTLEFIPTKKMVNETYCSLYLKLAVAPKDMKAKYELSMRNDADVELKKCSFDKLLTIGSSWGVHKFITHELLLKDLPNDVLIITCKIEIATDFVTEKQTGQIMLSVPGIDLSSDMGQLVEGTKFGDATVVVGERKFPVYKGILAARSPVFAAMFNHDLVEKTQNIVKIEDMEEAVFQELLRYIYTDKVDDLEQFAYELFAAADKYSILPLKTMCQQFILANLSVRNAAKTLLLAEMHQAKEMKARVLVFFGSAASRGVTGSADWKRTIKTHPQLLSDAFEAIDSRAVDAKMSPA